MSDARGPVRHGSRTRRPARPGQVDLVGEPPHPAILDEAPPNGKAPDSADSDPDLQATFATLARRSQPATASGSRPAEVLRAAGLPLLLAAMVATATPAAAAENPDLAPNPTGPHQRDGWTVTPLTGAGEAPYPGSDRPTAQPSPHATQAAAPSTRATNSAPVPARATPSPSVTSTGPAGAATGPAGTAPGPPGRITYTVRPGDTVTAIAVRSGRSIASIIALNGLRPDGYLRPGQVLQLPDPAPRTTTSPATPGPPTRAGGPASGRASPGTPTPSRTPPATTTPGRSAPGGSGSSLGPTPSGTSTPDRQPAPGLYRYLVRNGDTVTDIARRAGVEPQEVLRLNQLHLRSVLHPGQQLLLPDPPQGTSTEHAVAARSYPPAVVAAADANRRVLAARKLPTRDQAKALVVSTARALGVDPALALAVAYQESGFDQHQVSPANAVGVMQVVPSAAVWASTVAGRRLDLLNAKDNITAGVLLLRAMTASATTEPEAIAGYYQGLSSVRSQGMFEDTRRYVASVQTLRARFAAGG